MIATVKKKKKKQQLHILLQIILLRPYLCNTVCIFVFRVYRIPSIRPPFFLFFFRLKPIRNSGMYMSFDNAIFCTIQTERLSKIINNREFANNSFLALKNDPVPSPTLSLCLPSSSWRNPPMLVFLRVYYYPKFHMSLGKYIRLFGI